MRTSGPRATRGRVPGISPATGIRERERSMNAALLQAMARYIAANGWAEGGREPLILDRLHGAVGRLPALFRDWQIDFTRQEELVGRCLGFAHRDRLPAAPVPIMPARPPALRQFVATRPVVCFRAPGGRAIVGTSDPLVAGVRNQLSLLMGVPVDLVYLTPQEVEEGRDRLREALAGVVIDRSVRAAKPAEYGEESAPIVQLVDRMLRDAIRGRASGIHVEPQAELGRIRYRVDGLLERAGDYALELHGAIAARLKSLAGLDLAQTRLPQEGRARYVFEGTGADLRVSSVPSAHGETIAIRLLSPAGARIDLAKAGLRAPLLAELRALLAAPHGILLVTGPARSGKTTTLYGLIGELSDARKKIVTLEDPIERALDGIVQIPVDANAGLTFATGLRSLLSQDPDIVVVGEIRDRETAQLAVEASLAGHRVIGTLHADGAPTALARLIDMGVAPSGLSAGVQAILAQRLIRRVCPQCAAAARVSESIHELFRLHSMAAPKQVVEERGCESCSTSGFKGQMGVHEFLPMTESLRVALNRGAQAAELTRLAIADGMITLLQDGLMKVSSQETTVRELLRALGGGL